MLLCLSSFRDLSVLYKGLELPPIGQVIKFGPGIQVQSHGNLHFIVLRRNDKRQHITKAKEHLMIADQTLILDRTYEGDLEDGEFLVTNVNELEVFLPLTARGRNKLALEFFRDTTQHDIALGFQVLTTLVLKRSLSTPPEPQLRTHKRICAKECVVCMDEMATVLFNCGHECVCDGCCKEWMKVNQTCPICKERVTDVYYKKK